MYKWLLQVSANPRFLACKFQMPMGAYSRHYGTCTYIYKSKSS